jgi:hypothetical protein
VKDNRDKEHATEGSGSRHHKALTARTLYRSLPMIRDDLRAADGSPGGREANCHERQDLRSRDNVLGLTSTCAPTKTMRLPCVESMSRPRPRSLSS